MAQKKDEGLNGNEKIEQAVCQLQQEPTQEQLAHTLTVIRRRMRENGQVVVAVEPNPASEQMQLRALRTADEIQGIILNPWNRTIQLDKTLLRIIKG